MRPTFTERLERIGEEATGVIDARKPGPLDKIVGQNLVPQVGHFLRFGKEAMAANVEQIAVVILCPADASDVALVHLDDGCRDGCLGEQIGGGQTGGAGADHEDIAAHAGRRLLAAASDAPGVHRKAAP
jgi:hypothetical protein